MGLGAVQLFAGGAGGERAGGQAHVVVGSLERARGAAVLLVAELVGQVLAEGPPEGHIDQLHPAADAEHRHVPLDGAHGERELRAVALGHQMVGRGMQVGSVRGGVDVVAAGEDQPVEQVEQLVGLVLEAPVRRDHHRQAAGALDRLDVGLSASSAASRSFHTPQFARTSAVQIPMTGRCWLIAS